MPEGGFILVVLINRVNLEMLEVLEIVEHNFFLRYSFITGFITRPRGTIQLLCIKGSEMLLYYDDTGMVLWPARIMGGCNTRQATSMYDEPCFKH